MSWFAKKDASSEEGVLVLLHSGTVTHKEKVNSKIAGLSLRDGVEVLSNIQFTGINRKDGSFEVKEISVDELLKDLDEIMEHLELQLDEQLKHLEPTERHRADMFIHMKVKLMPPLL